MNTEEPFNYDLNRIKEAVESPTVSMPDHIKTPGEIRRWLLEESEVLEIERLVKLCEEKSYTMPSGLSRKERHEWAKQTLAAHEFHQEAQKVLCGRGKGKGVHISSDGLTEAQFMDKMAQYQACLRWYQVIVHNADIKSFPEGLYWDHVTARTQHEFMTMDFITKMDVYRRFITQDCANKLPHEQDAACYELLKHMRLVP